MRWIEILKIRSIEKRSEELLHELLRIAAHAEDERGLTKIKVYRHASMDSDVRVHLLWTSENGNIVPSVLGQRIASAMEEFGWVNHSVWMEVVKE